MKAEVSWRDGGQSVVHFLPEDRSLYEGKPYLELHMEPSLNVAFDRPVMTGILPGRITRYFVRADDGRGDLPSYTEIDRPDVGPDLMKEAVIRFEVSLHEWAAAQRGEVSVQSLFQTERIMA